MIIGSIHESARYESLHPAFKQVFDYIKAHDLLNAPLERIVLDGDRLFINNVEADAKRQEEMPLEAHRQYLDIHILLAGNERIGWRDLQDCGTPTKPYDEEGDYMLFEQPASTYVDLKVGQFAVVYPEDAHAPLIGEGKIRKLIVKALVNY
ncbi:YhcH/YjgK/YiaL family protein [Porphyromonas sp. COT-290 OH3588]|uniref:YhcH/YjgK/YiaL family protein n=1 Tax=Porphyromonas sp. COT-290 OH3588 TaxID=1515617 RepID=UPI00052D133C|nr:YhcH/YjgK/YiaL family protein [Porphyromonas sp. COT-290 OH3588]KGO01290.1 YhcH/YjgK/YiaL family protein [Porphyromonas sp. COT-290 OH3588]